MHQIDLIPTLSVSLAAALVLGYVTQRIGLSPIVGYLLAGVVVGPNTPGFIADRALADQLAEIGVILLMFGVGLHFHLKELLAVRRIAIPGAIGQSLAATLLGMLAAWSFGWSWTTGLVYGIAVSVASTVVLTRVLADQNDLHTPTGHIAVGWLVVEDLLTVIVLVLLPEIFGERRGGAGDVALALGITLVKISVLVLLTFLVGGRIIPWLLTRVAATRSRELFTLTILVVALGIAYGSVKFFGASAALGAFLAGMIVGRSDFSLRAASEALPMRDAFAVLFFVSVGMLLNPRALLETPGAAAGTLAIILLGKPLAAFGLVLFLGYPLRVALAIAVALAQIGEFSFILASLGKGLGLISDGATNALVAAAIVSISLNPLLYRLVDPAARAIARRPRLAAWLEKRGRGKAPLGSAPATGEGREASPRHRAVLVGYGPVGRTVARLLRENGIEPTVIELNLGTVHRLRAEGTRAVYGDATHRETLREAGLGEAGSLILSSAGMAGSVEVIRLAREESPSTRILACSAYVNDMPALERAGAEAVFSGEGEVALAFTVAILRGLGATHEQIDRERERVHADLFGRPGAMEAPGEGPPPGDGA